MKELTTSCLVAALMGSVSTYAENTMTVLTAVQAPVMVNQGNAYVPATDQMMLQPGDQLMVLQGGSAQINYANGCVQTVGANEIARVGTVDTCESIAAAGTYNQAGGTTSSGGGGSGGGLSGWDWVGLGAIGGMGIYIVDRATQGNSGSSTPPDISP